MEEIVMETAIYNKKHKVTVLGTEEGLYHIQFDNGACVLCGEEELEFLT